MYMALKDLHRVARVLSHAWVCEQTRTKVVLQSELLNEAIVVAVPDVPLVQHLAAIKPDALHTIALTCSAQRT